MILLGHIGPTLAVGTRFMGQRLDRAALLWLSFCAVLPDLVDKPFFLLGLAPEQTGRVWGHTLIFSLVWCLLCRSRISALWPWALATPGHLVLDAMWWRPHTLLWPLLGNVFDPPEHFFTNYWGHYIWLYENEPWTVAWMLAWEVAGLGLAAWAWRYRAFGWATAARTEVPHLPQQ